MKGISKFRFKQFSVWHHRSAMKVGVDGVLIGCWTSIDSAAKILDVGTGCGLIALIMAQRSTSAHIVAVEIDPPSVEEATVNVAESPWSDRVNVIQGSFPQALCQLNTEAEGNGRFDLILSNPPYFDSGVSEIVTPRERARHQGNISPSSILTDAVSLLNPGGSVAIIVPAEYACGLESYADSLGYILVRKCLVRGHKSAPYKRALLQWRLNDDGGSSDCYIEELTLEISHGLPTDEYRALCNDFYLKF